MKERPNFERVFDACAGLALVVVLLGIAACVTAVAIHTVMWAVRA